MWISWGQIKDDFSKKEKVLKVGGIITEVSYALSGNRPGGRVITNIGVKISLYGASGIDKPNKTMMFFKDFEKVTVKFTVYKDAEDFFEQNLVDLL